MKQKHVQRLFLSPFIQIKSHSISPPCSNEVICGCGFKWHSGRRRRADCLYRLDANNWGAATVSHEAGLLLDWRVWMEFRLQTITDHNDLTKRVNFSYIMVTSNLWSTVWIQQVLRWFVPSHPWASSLDYFLPSIFTAESEHGTTELRAQPFISDLSAQARRHQAWEHVLDVCVCVWF